MKIRTQRGISAVTITYLVLGTILMLAGLWVYKNFVYTGDYLKASAFDYPDNYSASCSSASENKKGLADHLLVETESRLYFKITTPSNYQDKYAHPLLVVWAPNGLSENFSEYFTGLTGDATKRGYVVVYTRSVPLGMKSLRELSTIVGEVIESWCIDEERIYYSGHSDGGTASNALAVMPDLAHRPTAIGPSAMGMQGKDMEEFSCPEPTAIMLMHNQGDNHFPNYGESVIQWWADCNACTGKKMPSEYPMCERYEGCKAATIFCQAEGNHAHWPGFEHRVLDFFDDLGSEH